MGKQRKKGKKKSVKVNSRKIVPIVVTIAIVSTLVGVAVTKYISVQMKQSSDKV